MTLGNKTGRRRRPLMAEINAVPYIDVMLVLLIVFMVAAPLLTQGVEVELPNANAAGIDDQDQEPVIVSVDNEGKFYLNVGDEPNEALDLSSLEIRIATLMQRDKNLPVLVRGDQKVNYGVVVQAMAALARAGVPNVGLVTQADEDL